jgi:hypothetical protein
MICPRCTNRGKTWKGSDPICAFETGTFDSNNWNCATMNALRNLTEAVHNEDHNACLLRGALNADFVTLVWYKRRGTTNQALAFSDEAPPQPLTLNEAEAILERTHP